MEKNRYCFKDGKVNVYPNYEYHPISSFLNKIPFLKVFAKLTRYLENGYRISKILKHINKKERITSVEFSEGGNFWNSLTKRYHYVTHLHGSSYVFKKFHFQNINLSDILARKAEIFFIKRANLVVAPSKMMSKFVSEETKKSITPIVLPYPLDKKFFKKNKIKNRRHNSKINILFASRNDPVKGGDLLIKAIENLSDYTKDKINVKFFGYKPDHKNISGIINFHDFIPQKELINEYAKADICVIPSIFDNSPYTAHEAMALGKILVVSDAGGIPEIIGDSECGYIFKSGNVNDLNIKISSAIELILTGKSIKMRQNAKIRRTKFGEPESYTKARLLLLKL